MENKNEEYDDEEILELNTPYKEDDEPQEHPVQEHVVEVPLEEEEGEEVVEEDVAEEKAEEEQEWPQMLHHQTREDTMDEYKFYEFV